MSSLNGEGVWMDFIERCFLCVAMTGFIVLVTNVELLCLR